MRFCVTMVASAALLVLGTHAAGADEVFLCADKTLLRIDSSKRAQQYEHPCVQQWFKTAGIQPTVAGAPATNAATAKAAESSSTDDPIRTMRAGRRR